MRKALSLSLVITGNLAAQSLNHDYNMGRIVGGDYSFRNIVTGFHEDESAIAPLNRYRYGVSDRYQVDLDLSGFLYSSSDRLEYGAGLVRLGGTYKADNGHMLDWHLVNDNIAITGTGHSVVSGFEPKYTRDLSIALYDRFLARDGYIAITPSDFELAFLRGPLLEAGQYRHTLGGGAYFSDNGDETLEIEYEPGLGLTRFLELGLEGKARVISPNDSPIWDNTLGVSSEFRLPFLWIAGEAHKQNIATWESASEFERYDFSGDAGLLFGNKQNLKFSHVEGNYDRFFSPLLGGRQLLLTHSLKSKQLDSCRIYDWTSRAQAGITSEFTVGATHHKSSSHSFASEHSLSLNAIYSNLPLRTEGPYDVADMEYLWGYIFQPGDWRVSVQWKTPLLDPSEDSAFIYSPAMDFKSLAPFSESPYYCNSQATVEFSALLGLAENWFGKLDYNYFAHGLVVPSAPGWPAWEGRAHAATLAFGYTRFNAIWEFGAQLQSGNASEDHDDFSIFPIYFKSIARF